MRMSKRIRNLVRAAVLSAIAVVLMFPIFEIPLSFFAPWLKLDFSTLPVLLAGFALGPGWGVAVQAVKSLLHWPMGSTGGIGEIADFVVGTAMMLPASLMYLKMRSRKGALIGMAIGVVCMTAAGALVNYFVMLPLYFGADIAGGLAKASPYGDVGSYITAAVIPFNLVKGVLVGAVTFFLYKYLRRFLHDPRS